MQIKATILKICFCYLFILGSFLGTNAQNRPFPQQKDWNGCIKPNNVSQQQMNSSVQGMYDYWKSNFLKPTNLQGGYYINGGCTGCTVPSKGTSEGHGYGMIITALMEGYDTQSKTYFDGLYKFFDTHRSTINSELMGWNVAVDERTNAFSSAADGDMDIAYALLLAHYQWGSGGAINYLQEAKDVITNGIKASLIHPSSLRVMMGDWDNNALETRSSDWMTAHFRAYQKATGDNSWNNIANKVYQMVDQLNTNNLGILPDFVDGNPAIPDTNNATGEPNSQDYYWNACRTPWRIATDFAHYGTPDARTQSNRFVNWAKTDIGTNFGNFASGYTVNGQIVGSRYGPTAFVAPLVVASITNSANQSFLNTGWNYIKNKQTDYYGTSINLLSMLVISGNWWVPEPETINPSPDQQPYAGTPVIIPGKIEAENYDLGGQTIAFNDVTASNQGGTYRNDAVDIEPSTAGGHNVGWIQAGEWLEYTIDVTASKTYTLECSVAAISSGRNFHIEVNKQNVSGTINVPNTNGWQNWQTVTSTMTLSQGTQVLRVAMDTNDFNIDYLIIKDEGIAPDPNQAPICNLTSPTNGQTFTEGDTVTINATASDIDGTITKVEFYDGNILLATDATIPYAFNWNTASVGNHVITAKAFDDDGDTTVSTAVTITVNTSGTGTGNCDVAPYIEDGGYVEGSQVQNNGNVYECKPYPFSGWCNGAAWAYAPGEGTYWEDAWTLVGECDGGTNPPGGNQPPTVSITNPTNGQSFAVGSTITINANASDTDGNVTKVEFFGNGTKLGEDTTSPYSYSWSSVSTGNYILTAAATDNENVTTESASVNISVGTTNPPPSGLPVRIMNGYWHNFFNGTNLIKLKDVSPSWDVINVSFAVPKFSAADGEIGFELSSDFDAINYTEAEFRSDIQLLQSQGKKIIISIGGAEGQVQLNTTAARDKFISSMIIIIEDYGFDGMDIDFEGQSLSFELGDTDFRNPTTPVIVNTIDAVRSVCNHFGNDFILTMAPETFFVQLGYQFYGGISTGADRRSGAYLPLIHALRDKLTFLQVQYYNSGFITALDDQGYIPGSGPDFYVSLVDMLLKGFPITKDSSKFFPALRQDQVLIGVPATVGAGGGHIGTQGVINALDYLINGNSFGGQYQLSQTYPDLRGVMSWSINWDSFENLSFSTSIRAYLDGLTLRNNNLSTILPKNSEVLLYPNPMKERLNIQLDINATYVLEFYNHLGIKVFTHKKEQKETQTSTAVDINQLESGLYFYTLDVGGQTYSGRVIKE
ncbi:glycosyl hydrolase family 8 [Aquimarina sp. 2304DJ70-9]|uniref:glycosyl hydrolase family 8 n=1 Tax=Aquimarina penaris TaxID=3231044 RepID=UPI003462D40C